MVTKGFLFCFFLQDWSYLPLNYTLFQYRKTSFDSKRDKKLNDSVCEIKSFSFPFLTAFASGYTILCYHTEYTYKCKLFSECTLNK